jgi:hypothetical protein
MDRDTIRFVFNALPKGRTLYYDFPDRYAVLLLKRLVGVTGMTVGQLKKTQFAPLLNKPVVKTILKELGGGNVTRDDLESAWPQDPYAYRLSLGTWPELDIKPQMNWHQVSRDGWNLVLQLNFSMTHNRKLQRMVTDWNDPLAYSMHPIAGGKEVTLAWSRIDFDMDAGEALIEEIQSDWVRDARRRAESMYHDTSGQWKEYVHNVMLPLTKRWSETMLTAAVWFLLEEMGICRIFYHTHDTGTKFKHIGGRPPPKSIYTELPRKFCFQQTHNGPQFLRDASNKKKHQRLFTDPETLWQVLDFTV